MPLRYLNDLLNSDTVAVNSLLTDAETQVFRDTPNLHHILIKQLLPRDLSFRETRCFAFQFF